MVKQFDEMFRPNFDKYECISVTDRQTDRQIMSRTVISKSAHHNMTFRNPVTIRE